MSKRILVKVTLRAAFEPERLKGVNVASLGEASADLLRDYGGLTVMSDYDEAEVEVAEGDDSDELIAALEQQFPEQA